MVLSRAGYLNFARSFFERKMFTWLYIKEVNATGKGIGLYLAGQMIINNDGTIHVESAGRGKGTTFIIELPMLVEASTAAVCRDRARVPIPKPPIRK